MLQVPFTQCKQTCRVQSGRRVIAAYPQHDRFTTKDSGRQSSCNLKRRNSAEASAKQVKMLTHYSGAQLHAEIWRLDVHTAIIECTRAGSQPALPLAPSCCGSCGRPQHFNLKNPLCRTSSLGPSPGMGSFLRSHSNLLAQNRTVPASTKNTDAFNALNKLVPSRSAYIICLPAGTPSMESWQAAVASVVF